MSTEKIRKLLKARSQASDCDKRPGGQEKHSLAEVENIFIEKFLEKFRLTERDIQRAFKKYDRDGSGYLDLAELSRAIHLFVQGVDYSQVQELVHYYDVNNDGKISLAEFAHFLMSRSSADKNEWQTVDSLMTQRTQKDAINRVERGERVQTDLFRGDDSHSERTSQRSRGSGYDTENSTEYKAKIFMQNLRAILIKQANALRLSGRIPISQRLSGTNTELTESIARDIISRLFQPYVQRGRSDATAEVFRVGYENFSTVLRSFEYPGSSRPTDDVLGFLFRRCGASDVVSGGADPDILVDMMFDKGGGRINRFGFHQPVPAASETYRPDVQTGPLTRKPGDVPLKISQVPFRFVTRRCRTTLAVPSNFNMAHLERSATMPSLGCVRDHVYGLSAGDKLYSNPPIYSAFLTNEGDISDRRVNSTASELLIYSSAALGVVYDLSTNSQRYFEGHTDDITCIAVSRDCKMIATGQMGKSPEVFVWESCLSPYIPSDDDGPVSSSRSLNGLICRIGKGFFSRGVNAAAFSFDSVYLCAIGCDDRHEMGIWALATGQLVTSCPSASGVPPQITMLRWGPGQQNTEHICSDHAAAGGGGGGGDCDILCTAGERHLKFWSFQRPSPRSGLLGSLMPRAYRMGKISVDAPRVQRCLDFVAHRGAPYEVVTGGDNGYVYVWKSASCACVRAAEVVRGGGGVSAIQSAGDMVICAGAQGMLKVLDLRTLSVVQSYCVLSPSGGLPGEELTGMAAALGGGGGGGAWAAGADSQQQGTRKISASGLGARTVTRPTSSSPSTSTSSSSSTTSSCMTRSRWWSCCR
jgi:hypothetical protein